MVGRAGRGNWPLSPPSIAVCRRRLAAHTSTTPSRPRAGPSVASTAGRAPPRAARTASPGAACGPRADEPSPLTRCTAWRKCMAEAAGRGYIEKEEGGGRRRREPGGSGKKKGAERKRKERQESGFTGPAAPARRLHWHDTRHTDSSAGGDRPQPSAGLGRAHR